MANLARTASGRGVITELVGPSGAGKTTLMSNLEAKSVISVTTVPRIFTKNERQLATRTESVQALFRGVLSGVVLSLVHKVSPTAWLRLARNCVAVEYALQCVRHLDGDWFVDEGPLRQLHDRSSGPGAELKAWKNYALRTIQRIGNRCANVRMIVLKVSPEIHERRYRERTQVEVERRRRAGGFRNLLGLFLDDTLRPSKEAVALGRFVEKAASLSGLVTVQSFECNDGETPDKVGTRFVQEVLRCEAGEALQGTSGVVAVTAECR